jgi:hypothetical protein
VPDGNSAALQERAPIPAIVQSEFGWVTVPVICACLLKPRANLPETSYWNGVAFHFVKNNQFNPNQLSIVYSSNFFIKGPLTFGRESKPQAVAKH